MPTLGPPEAVGDGGHGAEPSGGPGTARARRMDARTTDLSGVRQSDGQADRQTDSQTVRQSDSQAVRQSDSQTL